MLVQLTKKLENAALPIDQATGLPNDLYTSKDALAIEKERVFGPNWSGVGFAKDVPEPGDIQPVTFLGEPLILVHGRDGKLRVFQNACRHRGVKLVEKACKTTGLIRCPYHAWCYSSEGKLKQTPHVGGPGIHEHEAINKEEMGLIEVPSHVWLGVVFVNLFANAKPFEDTFATLLERWQDFERPIYHGGADSSFKLELKTNWKLAVENYCESYHLPFVHPGLNEYSKLEDHENILGDGAWSGQLTHVYQPALDGDGRSFANFENLPSRWDTAAEYIAVYPNTLIGVHKDHTFAIVIEPVSAGASTEHIEIFYSSPEMAGDDWSKNRQDNTALWKVVFKEDIGVVEGMQAGRNASGFDGGHFSPVMDEATHHFHGWIAQQMMQS